MDCGMTKCALCPDEIQNRKDDFSEKKPLVYLTLGDGDFTYSLDLAIYLKLATRTTTRPSKLILTGIDTLEALTAKYKDSPSVLDEIRIQNSNDPTMAITIRHGVNAIANPDSVESCANIKSTYAADHVLFHHPHLGTENCSLHKRFLAHLFHSVTNYWMKEDGGIFHLTLVEGQFERWKCKEQAERHGLELLNQIVFCPPSMKDWLKESTIRDTRYHYRRHQTGKSFGNRRPNSTSITYTFGRAVDKGKYIASHLPWQRPSSSGVTVTTNSSGGSESSSKPMLSCPFCEKKFVEKRSLKCHLRDKHRDTETSKQGMGDPIKSRKRKLMETNEATMTTIALDEDASISCSQCARVFQSTRALEDHIRAKHSGLNTYIPPDWSIAKQKETRDESNNKLESQERGEDESCDKTFDCRICGLKLGRKSLSDHLDDFFPTEGTEIFKCEFCSKPFRDERAKLQHMNFCSKQGN